MQALSQKSQAALVLISGLVLGWMSVADAELIPNGRRQQRQPSPPVVRRPAPESVEAPPADGVIQLKGTKIDVKVQKPQVQLFSARRKPTMGKGELERAFRETLRGASAWGGGHVPKIVVRKTKGGKSQTRAKHAQEEKRQEVRRKK